MHSCSQPNAGEPYQSTATEPSGPRFLFYSHDGQGLGHTRRNLAIAKALLELVPNAAALLVTGTDEVHRLGVPNNVGILKLPGVRKIGNECYEGRRLRISTTELLALRSSLLTATVQSFRPDVMLVDKRPFGVNGELLPALDALREMGSATVLGLRDILDDVATVRRDWVRDNLDKHIVNCYDLVLVYGHAALFDLITEYELSPRLAERTQYCGYILNSADRIDRDDTIMNPLAALSRERPLVLATPGGGEDGFAMLHAFAKAAAGAPWKGVMVTGPLTRADEHERLRQAAAEAGVTFFTFVHGLAECFASVDALVCMGGYNTLVEALALGTPTVCVPRIAPRTEQLLRARTFARLGLLQVTEPTHLDANSLRTDIAAALALSREEVARTARTVIDFDGAHHAARHLMELAASRRQAAVVAQPQSLLSS